MSDVTTVDWVAPLGIQRGYVFTGVELINRSVLMPLGALGTAKVGDQFITVPVASGPGRTDYRYYIIEAIADSMDNPGVADGHVLVNLKLIIQNET